MRARAGWLLFYVTVCVLAVVVWHAWRCLPAVALLGFCGNEVARSFFRLWCVWVVGEGHELSAEGSR